MSAHRADSVRRASFGLITAGYLALAVSSAMNPLLAPVAGVFVLMAYRLRVAGDAPAAARQRTMRRIALVGFALWALIALAESSSLSLVAAAVIWGGFRVLFSPESERSYYLSFLVALAQLVVSGGTTDSIVFALSIVLFIISGTLALAAMTLRGQRDGLSARFGERKGAADPGHPVPVIQNGAWEAEAKLLARLATIVTGVILAATVVLFFVIPRYGAGYFFSKDQNSERRAAFSDAVDFGAVGAVQQGGAIALRVELVEHQGPWPGLLYWRGIALGHFDGHRWSAVEGRNVVLHDVVKGFRESSHLVHGPFGFNSQILTQKIFLSEDQGLLFGASRIHRVWGKFTRLVKSGEDALLVRFPAYTARDYRCVSDVGRPPAEILRAAQGQPYPPLICRTYTQLPALDPRVKQLALQIAGDAATDYDRVSRLERWLRTQLTYELPAARAKAPEHPVEEFLFTRKRGHCEYFAASLAVLARTLGVPARVVNGYAGGTYSAVGGYYMVSDTDAHSWVEVFFPGHGWIDFDATPPDALGRGPQGFAADAFLYWDALLMAWRRYVVDYHLLDQVEYLRGLGRWLRGQPTDPAAPVQAQGGHSLPPVVGFVLLAAAVLVVLTRVLVRQAAPRGTTHALGEASFYLRLLELVARRGVRVPESQTPRERARAVGKAWPEAAAAVDGLTEAYQAARFGARPVDAPQVERWLAELARLK